MLLTAQGKSLDPSVNNALNVIESDLKDAVLTAIGRLNAVLDGEARDTRVVHGHLSDLHGLAAQIDQNMDRRGSA